MAWRLMIAARLRANFAAMDRQQLQKMLEGVRDGDASIEDVLDELSSLPFVENAYARVDLHRSIRLGLPEVILGLGKTPEQVCGISQVLLDKGQKVLVTQATQAAAEAMAEQYPRAEWHQVARCITVAPEGHVPGEPMGNIAIVTAGTSDLPVAEEARVVAEWFGNRVDLLVDVGVAGVHRLLEALDRLRAARVIVVVAGMEGALASVVGGLVSCPVIAVPTSVGYGASFGGLAALLGMLNSCSSGVTVVNIDNGFGAAYSATLINRAAEG